MERRLIVMRHAKSAWDNPGLTDHQRPLNKRGKRDAPRVGAALAERGWIPDLVLSSDSQRTRETFALLCEGLDREVEVKWLNAFYHGGENAVRAEVPFVDAQVGSLLVLGHNPGWEYLVESLSGTPTVMKTATAALLKAELDEWTGFDAARWKLAEVIYPREL